MYKVIVCGDREWHHVDKIENRLKELQEEHGMNLLVVSGGCRGADYICAEACRRLGIDFAEFPANWTGRKKSAGPVRNSIMFNVTQPNLVIAFHHNLDESKGTKNMVDYASKKGCSVEVIG